MSRPTARCWSAAAIWAAASSKLSILARLLDRELVIFDSFQGLPNSSDEHLRDHHCRRGEEWVTDWTAGRYAASLDGVRDHIQRYGETSVCRFVEGWFSDTMTEANLPARVAFAFADVDLASSAQGCLARIWPRLSDQGVYVTHDTSYIKVLQALFDRRLWTETLHSMPPILFGAGYGLCNASPHIGYMVKGDALSPGYLKTLTIDK